MKMTRDFYIAGDLMTLFINQGERDVWVLGTIDNQMIVEYEMPSGTTAMQMLKNEKGAGHIRSVSYTSCPKKWIQAIRDGVGSWEGNSQSGGHINFPEESR